MLSEPVISSVAFRRLSMLSTDGVGVLGERGVSVGVAIITTGGLVGAWFCSCVEMGGGEKSSTHPDILVASSRKIKNNFFMVRLPMVGRFCLFIKTIHSQ